MVPRLGSVVEERRSSPLRCCYRHDLLEGSLGQGGSGDQGIGLLHIGAIMPAVMDLESFGADMRFQAIHGIWQHR